MHSLESVGIELTVLVKEHNIATGQIDGVSSAQAGHCCVLADTSWWWWFTGRNAHTASADNNDSLGHGDW